jgi:hypothetical protein
MAVQTALEAKTNAPGFTVLWKGGLKRRGDGLFTPNKSVEDFRILQSAGRSDFRILQSAGPSDFSTSGGHYWAVDKEIGFRYAKWARNRSEDGHAVLLRLENPNALIEALGAPVLQYPSDLWKKFIHSCRRKEQPKELSYIHRETLLIGHIATGVTGITNLKDWIDISGRHMLRWKSDNGNAIQNVFNNMDGIEFLNRHCCTSLMMYRVEDEDFME